MEEVDAESEDTRTLQKISCILAVIVLQLSDSTAPPDQMDKVWLGLARISPPTLIARSIAERLGLPQQVWQRLEQRLSRRKTATATWSKALQFASERYGLKVPTNFAPYVSSPESERAKALLAQLLAQSQEVWQDIVEEAEVKSKFVHFIYRTFVSCLSCFGIGLTRAFFSFLFFFPRVLHLRR